MALDIAGAIRTRLAGDATLVALLSAYGSPSGPAIFVGDTIPEDMIEAITDKPAIIVEEPGIQDDASDYTSAQRSVQTNIRLYNKPNGSGLPMLNAAERARTLLHHWATESFSTGELHGSFVSGPQRAPTSDPSLEGRLLIVRLEIKE